MLHRCYMKTTIKAIVEKLILGTRIEQRNRRGKTETPGGTTEAERGR